MIQAANPQVVYVPQYNPTVVYGTPYVTPGYSTAAVVATAVVAFGVGIAVGAMMNSGCCGWGYSYWNCGWHGTTTVVYRGGAYYGNTAWRGVCVWPLRLRALQYWLQFGHRDLRPGRLRSRTATAARAPARRTTQRPGLMRAVLPLSNAYGTTSAAQAPTTREPGPLHPRCRIPMPTGAREPRRSRRTATPLTRSTKRTLTEPQAR